MILNLYLLLIIVLLLVFLSAIWPPDSPWWFTKKNKIKNALKLAEVSEKDTVYDLGSGFGTILIECASKFNANAVGIELDPLRYYVSKFLIKLKGLDKKIQIRKENFLHSDFSKATVVYVYLVPNALKRLKPKFLQELKPGTRIVSIKYEIDLPVVREIPYVGKYKIRLYRLPEK